MPGAASTARAAEDRPRRHEDRGSPPAPYRAFRSPDARKTLEPAQHFGLELDEGRLVGLGPGSHHQVTGRHASHELPSPDLFEAPAQTITGHRGGLKDSGAGPRRERAARLAAGAQPPSAAPELRGKPNRQLLPPLLAAPGQHRASPARGHPSTESVLVQAPLVARTIRRFHCGCAP